ncbi:MAG TPA: hypothetical protein VK742_02265 [Candidatus Sulfotelmatobacter sp.]|nr:hypothetical protein [Candidatus Sulfotelmatobacter sp.]
MKTIRSLPYLVVPLLATALCLVSGCATPPEHSFNDDFNQDLTAQPKYFVEDEGSDAFKITVHQGHTVTGQARVTDVKLAASSVAENEARKRGWKAWDVNYVRETDQGWMHLVVAEVTPKKAVEFSTPPATSSP